MNIKNIRITDNKSPKFIKTKLITYDTDDKNNLKWEMLEKHDSVHILIDNIETKEILLVKQIRIPILIKSQNTDGYVYEMCAGIVDKDIPLINIAREEILEEVGYDIPLENISFIRNTVTGVGSSGNTTSLYYAQIKEHYKVSNGGGINDEEIEVIKLPYNEVNNFINDVTISTDALTLFLLQYWILNKTN